MQTLRKLTIILILSVVLGVIATDKMEEVKSEDHCANAEYIPGWCVRFGQKYYFVESIPKATWMEAQHICRRNNGNLVTIESEAEMQAFSDWLVKEKFHEWEDLAFWTAGSDLARENEFWSIGNGEPLMYKKWAEGHPKKGNHCVGLKATEDKFAMQTLDCNEEMWYSYICELNTKGTPPYIKKNKN